ncbi:protein adenylyltransferase SelO [Methylotenera sp.]|uniref:protein adenylyltransferase SelO n=1 Tax=Methylotenera sp. TaxID=2051956 RepID=UPI002ED835C7
MRTLNFDNRFYRELPGDAVTANYTRQVKDALWSNVMPTPVKAPFLMAYSSDVAEMLGLSDADMHDPAMVSALGGNQLLEGMQPYATCYGGHQFGNWAGQLGDGRAIYLGELVHKNQRFELQLKGAGETPYSRRADGRAVLRSSLREFLCSEAMYYLGVPTTRALSLVKTGDQVVRDMFYDGNPQMEQGAIVCRVAPSFTRFGHFELLASRGNHALLKKMISFTIDRDFSDWLKQQTHSLTKDEPSTALIEAWFTEICERTARMIAHWMRVGFVHGVMNTDNMSITGLTIDYGPYGWIDNFDPGWTPNTTDAQGKRYCFGRQHDIGRWNLERLADALSTILPDAVGLNHALDQYEAVYTQSLIDALVGKFGLDNWQDSDGELINRCFELMTRAEVDMTLFFTNLPHINLAAPNIADLKIAFYTEQGYTNFEADFNDWLAQYAKRMAQSTESTVARHARMASHNPRYVLRNYLAQEAIDLAEQGDTSMIEALLKLLRNPYTEQAGMERFEQKRPDWARHKAGCSMLSCSS